MATQVNWDIRRDGGHGESTRYYVTLELAQLFRPI